jgi:MOSC domain-containing protein YiiM
VEASAARIASVNISPGGVPKLPVEGAWVGSRGLAGDGHNEPEPSHGGPDKAVCLYAVESIARVAADGHTAFPGAFGENLTLQGIELLTLASGDRLAIGDAGLVIQLTERSEPCQTIAHWFVDRRIARIGSPQHPEDARWYARVLREGTVRTGDRVERLTAS